jgi:hypothetical protein
VKDSKKESGRALLAGLKRESAQPRVAKSARAVITRLDFEAKPEWRATIRRRDNLAFILEGQGALAGKFYEYPDDWIPRNQVNQPLEVPMQGTRLRRQLAAGEIELLKGVLPRTDKGT